MRAEATYPTLRVKSAPVLPVAKLVMGKPVGDVAELLPRLFNLCRVAQGTAARAAFGLPLPPDWQEELRKEILREHLVKLCLKWPGLLSIHPVALPRNWAIDAALVREAVFGKTRHMPATHQQFIAFLKAGVGIAPVLSAIQKLFAPAQACRPALPIATPNSVFVRKAQENSVAARHAAHPVLRGIEATLGRGPLWSATAVAVDLDMCLDGHLPPASLARGRAIIPAARGYYGVRARVEQGRVTAFRRITPTDHMLAKGGALEQALATLPANQAEVLAPLLLSILDPCFPVAVEAAATKEVAHA